MYFAIMKLTFSTHEGEAASTSVKQELNALTEKLRARFRIAILPGQMQDGEPPTLAMASLAHSEEALARQLDAICEFCESSGFGRIESERTLLDHIDAFGDDEGDEDTDDDDGDYDRDDDIDDDDGDFEKSSDEDDDDDTGGDDGGNDPGPRRH